jgi:hypothetical protein
MIRESARGMCPIAEAIAEPLVKAHGKAHGEALGKAPGMVPKKPPLTNVERIASRLCSNEGSR